MRNIKKSSLFFILLFSHGAFANFAGIKVIYGDDGRQDLFDVSNPKILTLAKSTAAMVANNKLQELNAEQVKLGGRTLEDGNVCSSERFSKQPTTANCSGFLVGEDILVTAGHCIKNQYDCDLNSWVFDYSVDFEDESEVVVEKSNIYKCREVISRSLDNESQNDYAVLKLSRVVEDRKILKIRKSGRPSVGQGLFVIGHPSGLPTKVTSGGVVRSVNNVFMVTNLDTYGGNSGSAVFNSLTQEVEGILVRGEVDYKWDGALGCRVSNRVAEDAGRGEDVTLISSVSGIPEQEEDEVQPAPAPAPTPPPANPPTTPSWWQRFLEWLSKR